MKASIVPILINADGQAVVWAAKFLNKPLKERVAGIDLMEKMVELAFQKNYKLYFLGAEEAIVSQMVEHYRNKYNSRYYCRL